MERWQKFRFRVVLLANAACKFLLQFFFSFPHHLVITLVWQYEASLAGNSMIFVDFRHQKVFLASSPRISQVQEYKDSS